MHVWDKLVRMKWFYWFSRRLHWWGRGMLVLLLKDACICFCFARCVFQYNSNKMVESDSKLCIFGEVFNYCGVIGVPFWSYLENLNLPWFDGETTHVIASDHFRYITRNFTILTSSLLWNCFVIQMMEVISDHLPQNRDDVNLYCLILVLWECTVINLSSQFMLFINCRFPPTEEYVTCHTCRSSETILHKENRLFFLQCESCQSRCSVASIKSGFQAVTSKRATMRAKNNW